MDLRCPYRALALGLKWWGKKAVLGRPSDAAARAHSDANASRSSEWTPFPINVRQTSATVLCCIGEPADVRADVVSSACRDGPNVAFQVSDHGVVHHRIQGVVGWTEGGVCAAPTCGEHLSLIGVDR